MANEAAWIPAAKAQLIVKDETETPTPTPSEGEVLVKVKSIAFSPIESKIQKFVSPIPLVPFCQQLTSELQIWHSPHPLPFYPRYLLRWHHRGRALSIPFQSRGQRSRQSHQRSPRRPPLRRFPEVCTRIHIVSRGLATFCGPSRRWGIDPQSRSRGVGVAYPSRASPSACISAFFFIKYCWSVRREEEESACVWRK